MSNIDMERDIDKKMYLKKNNTRALNWPSSEIVITGYMSKWSWNTRIRTLYEISESYGDQ